MDLGPTRQYTPIWERLKRDHVVSITTPRALHRRIKKAVRKEKYMDFAYKFQIEPRHAVISISSSGSILTFRLHFSLISEDF